MNERLRVLVCGLALLAFPAANVDVDSQIDAYLQPYVRTNNFWGVVRVERNGSVVFERAYGYADRQNAVRNEPATRFHIASISMQFTAAAVLTLADRGKIALDSPVGDLLNGVPGARGITPRELLEERSGLPDINTLPNYNDLLARHQTPQSLVDAIAGKPLQFPPGSKYLREEHSAYNALALLVERATGKPFPDAVDELVFRPLGLADTGEDSDASAARGEALGYAPIGASGLAPAAAIHWSAKAGNASTYTTASDIARWIDELFTGKAMSPVALAQLGDTTHAVGYGWFKRYNELFDETVYYMNGRSPGFASFVAYLPREHVSVVVLGNIYSSATTTIGFDVAAIELGKAYVPFKPVAATLAQLRDFQGEFQFGANFYQPNALMRLRLVEDRLELQWPGGSTSALIPLGGGRFIDRSYWEEISFDPATAARPAAMHYGAFVGIGRH